MAAVSQHALQIEAVLKLGKTNSLRIQMFQDRCEDPGNLAWVVWISTAQAFVAMVCAFAKRHTPARHVSRNSRWPRWMVDA